LKGHEALCTGLQYQQQKDKSNVKSPYHGIKVADLLEKGKRIKPKKQDSKIVLANQA
jgi:hypothetical protein